jgi:hypothetical protein
MSSSAFSSFATTPTIREQILAAIETLLVSPGLNVHRERTRPIDEDSLPAVVIKCDDDAPRTLADQRFGAPLTERCLEIKFECRAQGGDRISPDQALDPVLAWVVYQVMNNERLGGLAMGATEGRTVWNSREGDQPIAAATLNVSIKYRTSRLDPTSKG